MGKRNCWEVMKCGRQTGGHKVAELGECPAVSSFSTHQVNMGINGGRACWAVAGTFCGGKVQGAFVEKIKGCASCNFFHTVQQEEGDNLVPAPEIINIINTAVP